MTWNEMVVT